LSAKNRYRSVKLRDWSGLNWLDQGSCRAERDPTVRVKAQI
jgi:hypothetical protein